VEPPKVEGPATGRHRAVPTPLATVPADRPRRRARVGDVIAGISAHPPTALRWAMLGAAVVILIAVPLMSLSGDPGTTRDTATETTADELEAEPTARVTSTLPGLPPTSPATALPATEAVVESPAVNAGAGTADAGTAGGDGSSDDASASHAAGRGAAPVGSGSAATTSPSSAAGGQAGGSSSAAKQSSTPAPTTRQPAATSSTPAQPTKTCTLDLLGLCI
jgi:hypothetical protein